VDGCWNSWAGWGPAEEKQGDVGCFTRLLDYIFKNDKEARRWFLRWLAYPIQYPGTKMYSSCLLWSVKHGTGKSLLAYMVKEVYGANGIEIDSDALRASFNAWAENKQYIIGDEITAGDARLDKDKLKSLITRPYVRINQKYLPEYTVKDCANYLFTSNAPDALFVEDGDRRYFVWELVGEPLPRDFYDECDRWLHSPECGAALLHYLRRVDLGDFNPRERAMDTQAKKNMMYAGKSDLGVFVAELREDPRTKLLPLGEKIADTLELVTPGVLLRCYDPEGTKRVTPAGMARELQRSGFRPLNGGSPIWTKAGTQRLYAVRNQDAWVTRAPKFMAEHWEQLFLEAQKI
jgi:hypothetical protein